MIGLDDRIADLGGGSWQLALLVALLLGLRHATDPDHLTAVSMLVAGDGPGDGPGGARRARRLGVAWGLGHAATLFAFGMPVVLFGAHLPAAVQRGAEVAVGLVIIAAAVRVLARPRVRGHRHDRLGRTPRAAFAIGLVHGTGGSAGVSLLIVGSVAGDHAMAAMCLAILALGAALSMALASSAFGYALARGSLLPSLAGAVPALGVGGVLFGAWYALAALQAAQYPF